jgi:hypothetical protein
MRPATASSRRRSRLGSQRRAECQDLCPDQQVSGQHGDLHHGDIVGTITAEGHGDRQIGQHLGWVVYGTRCSPPRQPR